MPIAKPLCLAYYYNSSIKKNWNIETQDLEQNLPLDNIYKSKDVVAAPIRVIQLIYNAGVSFKSSFLLILLI